MSLELKLRSWQFPRYWQFNKWYYSSYLSGMTPGGKFTLGGGLASTTGCAYLYTCPFWISVRLYLRGRSSDKQNRVFPRENKTKVNYNKLDYKIIRKIPGWLIVR